MTAVIVISAVALALYVAPLLPVVVGIITKSDAAPALKGTLLVVLSGITALVAPAVQNGTDIDIDGKWLGAFVVTTVVAIATHFGVLKPLGVTGSDGKVASATAGFGIG